MEWVLKINTVVDLILIFIISYCILLYSSRILYVILGLFSKSKILEETNQCSKFAVLIPARDESKVIDNILKSLKNQTYDSKYFDVFLIVESCDDPTIDIVKRYNYKYFVRGNVEGKQTKGWALDECVQEMFKNRLEYDAIVIFDADNVLDENYLKIINKHRIKTKAKLGLGNRQGLNTSKNWISACSSIMLNMLSIFGSKGKSKMYEKVILCGTGYYFDYDCLKEAGGFVWHSLCEDNELCLYTFEKDLKCIYIEEAIFYDEQPIDMKTNIIQHTRWVYGILQSNKLMRNKIKISNKKNKTAAKEDYLLSNLYLTLLVSVSLINIILHIISGIICYVNNEPFIYHFIIGFSIFMVYYLLFVTISIIIFFYEKKHYKNIPLKKKITASTLFFFYLLSFFLSLIYGFKKENRKWIKIEHYGK